MSSNTFFVVMVLGVALVAAEEDSRGERSVTTDYHDYSKLCESQPNKFICVNCKTMVQCVKGQAFTRHCIENHYCSMKPEFGGGVCYPDEPKACKCEKANSFRVDPYDPQRFFSCKNLVTPPVNYKCPDGMVFDEASAQCQTGNGLPQCTEAGTFANPANCSVYYSCIGLRHGWLQKSFQCNSGLMYNKEKGVCEDPCLYQFVCKQEGRYPDLLNQQNYFECYMLGGKLRQLRYSCPEGYRWDEISAGVGQCVEDHDKNASKGAFFGCDIPDGFCPGS
uniref:Peritrophin-like protein 1 n=1 Tax=Penaeus vannamei TaxID=6689 RepID=A0A1L6BQD0_PENVA|nr:peritrophin-like protein 1 [Penaeus vannamei]